MKKRKVKNYILGALALLLVAAVALLPVLTASGEGGTAVRILSGRVQSGTIVPTLAGGGTLTEQTGVAVTVPNGVEVTEYLVKNGDLVREGDPVARVDRVSVMSAITEVQDALAELEDEIEDAAGQEDTESIYAQTDARVKLVYAEEGDDVRAVMQEHGALAVLSLDGRMAVTFDSAAAVRGGQSVTVELEDGTALDGRVESALDGVVTVTLTDDGAPAGGAVRITDGDGGELGQGELYIHSPWNAVSFAGTVSDVNITPEEEVDAGDELIELTGSEYTAEYARLTDLHRTCEDVLLELFRLYQDPTVAATADGCVTGADESIRKPLAFHGDEMTVTPLGNAPGADPDGEYENKVGMLLSSEGGAWTLAMQPGTVSVTDYKNAAVDTAPGTMTEGGTCSASVPVYALSGGEWESASAAPGDVLLLAFTDSSVVWAVRVGHNDLPAPTPEPTPTPGASDDPAPSQTPAESASPAPAQTPAVTTTPGASEELGSPQTTEAPEETAVPSASPAPTPGTSDAASGEIGSSGTGTGGFNFSGMDISGYMSGLAGMDMPAGFQGGYSAGAVPEEQQTAYEMLETRILSVVPQDVMTVEISMDELDIAKLVPGQTAEITVDALSGQVFEGVVVQVGGSAENSGGHTKYPVTLLLPRSGAMLSGMNASATIALEASGDVLTIPVAALYDDGARSFVYTSYDEAAGVLGDPVYVTCGASDGESVAVLSGLTGGQEFWYEYVEDIS